MMRQALFGVFLPLTLLAGCATPMAPHRAHPQLEDKARAIKTVALMPPDVKVYQLSAGNVRELMDEWSERGKRNVADGVAAALAEAGGFAVKEFTPGDDPALREEYEDVRALFAAVAGSIVQHTYLPALAIPDKRDNFRYSLGPLRELARAAGADALLFVSGVDDISTAGRVATQVIGAVFGVAIPSGRTRLAGALVEAESGDVLWFNIAVSQGEDNFRKPSDAASLAREVFGGFKPARPKP